MPRLSELDGIVIWINTRDHLPPHFHARHSGKEVRIDIATLRILTGVLAPSKQRMLHTWATIHRAELMRNWELAQRGLPSEPIPPHRRRRTPDGP